MVSLSFPLETHHPPNQAIICQSPAPVGNRSAVCHPSTSDREPQSHTQGSFQLLQSDLVGPLH